MALAPEVPAEIKAMRVEEVYSILLMNQSELKTDKDKYFAADLLDNGSKHSGWTYSQESWARFLVAKLTGACSGGPDETELNADFTGVFLLIKTAKANGLKWPAVWLKLPSGGDLKVSLAGPNSKYCGKLMLTDGKAFGQNKWYGAIDDKGNWKCPAMVTPAEKEQIADTLLALAADPGAVATKYGKQTNHCCFCGKGLTDPKSVMAGYGPVCAEKFGLKKQWTDAVLTNTAKAG